MIADRSSKENEGRQEHRCKARVRGKLASLSSEFYSSTNPAQLALRESEFLLELSHSNIVKLEGFVEDISKGVVWLVFLWEDNGNLRDFLGSGEWEIPERISLV